MTGIDIAVPFERVTDLEERIIAGLEPSGRLDSSGGTTFPFELEKFFDYSYIGIN